jgi:hypothetical protein
MKTITISTQFIPVNFTGIVEFPDGTKKWYKEGKYHREDGPAVEFLDGSKEWYREGKHHRLDGPAIEHKDGTKYWYKEGKYHREDGPAIEFRDGTKFWHKEGKFHRLDGPAIECSEERKEWYIENDIYSPKKLSELINSCFYLGKEKGQYNLEWLKFLTEEGIKEFPIIPGMKEYKDFENVFEALKEMEINENNKSI